MQRGLGMVFNPTIPMSTWNVSIQFDTSSLRITQNRSSYLPSRELNLEVDHGWARKPTASKNGTARFEGRLVQLWQAITQKVCCGYLNGDMREK